MALSLRIATATVMRVRDVDRDRDLRLGGIRARPRSGEVADLLLHGGDGDEVAGPSTPLREPSCRLERDVATDPVVERPRGDSVAGQRDRLSAPERRVPGAPELL